MQWTYSKALQSSRGIDVGENTQLWETLSADELRAVEGGNPGALAIGVAVAGGVGAGIAAGAALAGAFAVGWMVGEKVGDAIEDALDDED